MICTNLHRARGRSSKAAVRVLPGDGPVKKCPQNLQKRSELHRSLMRVEYRKAANAEPVCLENDLLCRGSTRSFKSPQAAALNMLIFRASATDWPAANLALARARVSLLAAVAHRYLLLFFRFFLECSPATTERFVPAASLNVVGFSSGAHRLFPSILRRPHFKGTVCRLAPPRRQLDIGPAPRHRMQLAGEEMCTGVKLPPPPSGLSVVSPRNFADPSSLPRS